MTATAAAGVQIRDRLKVMESRLRELRAERADLAVERDKARKAFAGVFDTADEPTATPEFRHAQAATDRLAEHDALIAKAQDEHVGVLKLLTGRDDSGGDLPPGAGAHHDAVRALKSTPGAWLGHVLERRKGDVSTLPQDLRFKVAPAFLDTTAVSTTAESDAMIDLLSPQSVAIASGITTLRIDTTKTRIPRFTELPQAAWIAERAAFPKSAPAIEMVDVEPPKVGLVSPLSIEVFEDLTPLGLSMVQQQILRAVALAFDEGILFGSGTNDEPRGIANTSGIGVVTAPLTDLGAFAQAIAALVGTNAYPGALAMNPLDLGTLLQLTEFTGGTNSNVPLWKAAIERPDRGAFSLTLPYFGVPIWPTPAAPRGTALLYDPRTVIAVIRREADIAIDPYYGFDTGEVGLRTYLRGDVVVGQPASAVMITFGTP